MTHKEFCIWLEGYISDRNFEGWKTIQEKLATVVDVPQYTSPLYGPIVHPTYPPTNPTYPSWPTWTGDTNIPCSFSKLEEYN